MNKLLYLFLAGTLAAAAQTPVERAIAADDTPTLVIPRVKRPPKLSDFLNGVPREAEVAVSNLVQFDPGDGDPVTQPTTAFLSYDDRNLYVGWICKDDPKLIRSRVAKRKDIVFDDRVTINIDTFHDHRHAYWFDVNAHGVQLDGITTDGYGDDFSWEGLWYTESKITSDGYVVLETIPFKTLRFPNTPKQQWGFVLARFINRNNEFSMWPHVSRKKMPAFVAQFGHLDGLENISPGRNMQFIPYLQGSTARFLDTPPGAVPGLKRESQIRGGLDAKMVIKDALTLDLTMNPDFSQVESDEPQVTLNQRFEVVYPEKRPFFMENASYFTLPQQLFFSRRIVDPQFGVRLTGKVGRWAIGVLTADDRAPRDRAMNSVLSIQREFAKDSHIRAFVTDREQSSHFNRVASLDTRLRLKHGWFLTNEFARSESTEGSGGLFFAGLSHMDRHWESNLTYRDITSGFRAELGYIPRTDIREAKEKLTYKWRPEKKVVTAFGPTVELLRNWNHAGTVQDWGIKPGFVVEMLRLTEIEAGRREEFELYQNLGFRKGANYIQAKSDPYKWFGFMTSYSQGSGVNYYPATGMRPFLADTLNGMWQVTLRPTERLRLDETYLYNRLSTQGTTIYNNHIVRSKANYQFTREFAFRAIIDYNGVLPNESLIAQDRTKRVGYDFLFTWLLHPGTAVYAGYTDIYQNLALDPSRPPYLRFTVAPELATGRQAFVKLSYLVRF